MCFGMFLTAALWRDTSWRTSGPQQPKNPAKPCRQTGMLEPVQNGSVEASNCKMDSSIISSIMILYTKCSLVNKQTNNRAMETEFKDVSLKMRDFNFHILAM